MRTSDFFLVQSFQAFLFLTERPSSGHGWFKTFCMINDSRTKDLQFIELYRRIIIVLVG